MKLSKDYINALPDSAFAYITADGARHLPYRNADGRVDLPMVRDALAQMDTVVASEQKSAVKDKLQGSLKASDADDDVMSFTTAIKASDGEQLPQRMMLLRAGTFNTSKYGEVPLSTTDIKEMADNFKAGIGMAGDGSTGIPVDFAHQSHLNAAAWIKDVAIENDGKELWATSTEWSKSGREAIVGKEYKCLSSDFYPAAFGEWVDAESGVRAKNVIVGAALTNRPMFTGNQPLVASETTNGERQITKFVIANEKEQSMNIDEIRVKAADDVTGAEQRFLQANADKLSTDEKKKFDVVEVTASATTATAPEAVQASSIKGTEGVVAVQASDIKDMQDTIANLKASDESRVKAGVEADVDKHIARGAIKSDRKTSWVDRMMASDENGRKEILADLEALADNPALAPAKGSSDANSTSEGGASARDQLMAHATDLMKKSKTDGKPISIVEASALASEMHPELVEAAEAEAKSRLQASDDQFTAAGVNRG